MKRLAIGAAAVGGAALALRHLARTARAMHDQCREMMRNHCASSAGCQPQ